MIKRLFFTEQITAVFGIKSSKMGDDLVVNMRYNSHDH